MAQEEVNADESASGSSGVSQSEAGSAWGRMVDVLIDSSTVTEKRMSSGYVKMWCRAIGAAGSGICEMAKTEGTSICKVAELLARSETDLVSRNGRLKSDSES